MELNEILAKNITNGRFFTVKAETEKKLKGEIYKKYAVVNARFGVNYQNLKEVKADTSVKHRESWFEHTEHSSIVRSKKDSNKLYLQIMNPNQYQVEYEDENGNKFSTEEMIRNGKLTEKELEMPLTLVYALENVKEIKYNESNNK